MRIRKILIEGLAREKILKHGLQAGEVENALLHGNPKITKERYRRYVAITSHNRYITVIFEYANFNAEVITAYKSSDWQIRKYQRK